MERNEGEGETYVIFAKLNIEFTLHDLKLYLTCDKPRGQSHNIQQSKQNKTKQNKTDRGPNRYFFLLDFGLRVLAYKDGWFDTDGFPEGRDEIDGWFEGL